ncbi:MAG TPA: twin-arginine translocase subunit TatC [Candidatus Saccharimonadales bacterium]|nr:twin-arginine translocase subunit TatC [Candidatus Saccharimonadales bacterium]
MPFKRQSRQTPKLQPAKETVSAPAELTVLEHIQEFRARLFWVVGSLLITSTLGYSIKDQILKVLMRPLGNQQLYYLTPIGGLSFIIKLCLYFGILVSVPLIIYHLYRYIQPIMGGRRQPIARYIVFSFVLAVGGVTFSYFLSLPEALHFLTGFNINHISAMLTVDAYLTFVTTYLLGSALLFQIPLVMLIIDNIKPLKPSGMMKYQRHVILASFIIAAVISPTPDMFNQFLFAVPIIAMYQIGLIAVWLQGRGRRKRQALAAVEVAAETQPLTKPMETPVVHPVPAPQRAAAQALPIAPPAVRPQKRLISDFGPRVSPSQPKPTTRAPQPLSRALIPERQVRLERPRPFPSIDGIIARS